MPVALAAALQVAVLVVVLAAVHRPIGAHIARTFTSPRHLRVERLVLRLIGADPDAQQTWSAYARSVVAFSLAGVLVLYAMQRLQALLPLALGLPAVEPTLAFNTAISFVTNTNWQSYSPELTLGHTVQAAGLAVQNVLSAAVGIAVAVALVRGIAARRQPGEQGPALLGSFWVDLVRGTTRILLPGALVAAVLLVLGGVVQNLAGPTEITTLVGGAQSIPGGPVASQEAIKLLGTNGGGFFNANSAHPFENPSGWTNMLQLLLLTAIPFALPNAFGRMIGDRRQGRAILAAMAVLAVAGVALLTLAETAGRGSAPELAGAAMEGKETRFGVVGSAMYAALTTLTSTGAVNAMHDSLTALGGGVAMIDMMLGEVAPGGVGSGLYGMVVIAVLAVFVAGLMVGRTPEYLGRRIGATQVKLVGLYILVTPTIVLTGTALSFAIPAIREDVVGTSMANDGLHGFSEVLYAFTSAANNNGSAFAGLTASTPWFNVALGVAMLLGRLLPIVLVLALAGSLAGSPRIPETSGTLPTHRPLFIGLLIGTVLIVSALTYFPVLALGPLAEGLL